ncbi:MAG: haloacid dehalogenase type II [Steroidobacteraceae bacterium]
MSNFHPRYISFDCYGTLIRFRMSELARTIFADRIPADAMELFCRNFAAYRLDEVLGAWKPYSEVIHNAVRRTCKLWKIEFRAAEARQFYDAVPGWGPHPDVPAGLARVAAHIPLVILSNAANEQIMQNVSQLGAPFHRVYTAEQAQAYKPRLQAFEYMFDQLGCSPSQMMHVSSSMRYDQMSAHDLGFGARVFVARGHEPAVPEYGIQQIRDISELPGVLGL